MIAATITDPADPRVADYRDLRDPVLRTQRGLFIAESTEVIACVLAAPCYRVRSLLVTANAHERLAPLLVDHPAPVLLASREVLTAITGVQLHRGGLALVERGPEPPLDRILGSGLRRTILLEDVTNPDNVGSIFRTARAFGVDAVLLSAGSADPLYRKTVRVSLGASVLVPWARYPDLADALALLRRNATTSAALTTSPAAIDLDEFVARGLPPRVALILGNEGTGLSAAARRAADLELTVRMAAGVDSINVAATAAIALHRLR